MSKWYAINFDGSIGLCPFNPAESSGFPLMSADSPSEMEDFAIASGICLNDINWDYCRWDEEDEKILEILFEMESAEMGIDEIETIIDEVKSVEKLSGITIPDLSAINDEDDLIDAWYDLQSSIEDVRK